MVAFERDGADQARIVRLRVGDGAPMDYEVVAGEGDALEVEAAEPRALGERAEVERPEPRARGYTRSR